MAMEMVYLLIGIGGLVFGLCGFLLAVIQYRSRIRVEGMIKSELVAILNRVKNMLPKREKVDRLLENAEDKGLIEWISTNHKGLSFLYVMVATHMLTFERKFTYEDLKTLVENRVVSSKWQENIWRDLISRRPENVGVTPPEPFIK